MQDFTATKIELLKGLYVGLTSANGQLSYDADEVLTLSGLKVSSPYASKALDSLMNEGLLDWSNGYSLTETGILLAEQRLFAEIPASDRVVKRDHNSAGADEILAAADALVDQLKAGNDVGQLSADEVEVAILEVQQLGETFSWPKLRVDTTLEKANRTLKWIGTKAAETLIGTAALALLALILRFFGIA